MSNRRVTRAGWLVVLLAMCAYGASLFGEYVFDDIHSVSANPAVHSLANFGQFWTDPDAFSAGPGRMYRPALLTSFAINWAISPAAWSLKLGNVLIHAAVSGMLFLWLFRLTRRSRGAFVVASLFAVHPLASEAINLVSARSELLAALGIVMALFAHVNWQRGGKLSSLLMMVFATVLACGSKETGVVIPGLLLVQTFCLRHRVANAADWRRAMMAIAPVILLVVGYLVVRKLILGQATVQLLGRTGGDPSSGHGRTLVMQLATMGTLLPRMLWQSIAPTQLSLDPVVVYRDSFLDPAVMIGWGTMLGLTVVGVWRGVHARLRRIGTAMAWAIALPWIIVPLNVPFAEHRFYGPMLGLAAIAVTLLPRLRVLLVRVPRPIVHAAVGVLLTLFVVGSAQRSLLYQDERDLWLAELAQNPESFRGWWGTGACQMRYQKFALAVAPLERAHELYPEHHDALRNLVEALVAVPDEQADAARSLAVGAELLERSPNDPWVRTLVVQANLQAARLMARDDLWVFAEQMALSCLEISTPRAHIYRLAARARHGQGDVEGALAHLDTSVERGLNFPDVQLDRALLLHELGRTKQAREVLFDVRIANPFHPRIGGVRAILDKPHEPAKAGELKVPPATPSK
ncbi:MAG: tetratricopeptide (TPR) repeat protein [Planctomycetota bacterium]